MKGDFSRWSYLKEKQYCGVLQQQGRVQVDADWNEQQEINQHRIETEARDVIGRSGTPADDPGFEITIEGTEMYIGGGRYYVDGILCENFPTDGKIAYSQQGDLPNPPTVMEILKRGKGGLVFLHVMKRHITALDDPHIQEKALGGTDTCTRIKTVWQVGILPLNDREFNKVLGDCDAVLRKWDLLTAESSGLMNAQTWAKNKELPCRLPPSSGYKRLENQLYRVEIHRGGSLEDATFKWSRDNGSVVTSITGFNGTEITVADLGKDEVLGFKPGDWVEISDDRSELIALSGLEDSESVPGSLMKIVKPDPATNTITFESAVKGFDTKLHAKLRRWDQTDRTDDIGKLATSDGVKITGDWQLLEDGIYVRFMDWESLRDQVRIPHILAEDAKIEITSPNQLQAVLDQEKTMRKDNVQRVSVFRTGDYWLIPARTATHEIEWPPFDVPNDVPKKDPLPQPPLGIEHHYCRLALISMKEGKLVVKDCRNMFPPLREPGVHIVKVWIGKEALKNDGIVTFDQLIEEGVVIECDREIDSTIKEDPSEMRNFPNPRCFISLEIPIPYVAGLALDILLGVLSSTTNMELLGKAARHIGKEPKDILDSIQYSSKMCKSASLGFINITLAAKVTSERNKINWALDPSSFLKAFSTKSQYLCWFLYESFMANQVPVMAHLTLKGNFIWSNGTKPLFLDGEAFGTKNDDLKYPSGDGRRGGDFEMWFWIRPAVAPPPEIRQPPPSPE